MTVHSITLAKLFANLQLYSVVEGRAEVQSREDAVHWRQQEEEWEEHSSEQGGELSHRIPLPSPERNSGARQQISQPRRTRTQKKRSQQETERRQSHVTSTTAEWGCVISN